MVFYPPWHASSEKVRGEDLGIAQIRRTFFTRERGQKRRVALPKKSKRRRGGKKRRICSLRKSKRGRLCTKHKVGGHFSRENIFVAHLGGETSTRLRFGISNTFSMPCDTVLPVQTPAAYADWQAYIGLQTRAPPNTQCDSYILFCQCRIPEWLSAYPAISSTFELPQ